MMPADRVDESSCRGDHRRLVDAHFRGRSAPAVEREMRANLVTCAGCRRYYERHLDLAAVDPEAALPTRERLARGLGLSLRATRMRERPGWLGGLVPVAAVCLGAALWVGLRPPSSVNLLQSRSGGRVASQLLIYEVSRRGEPRPVTSQMNPDHGLAFAYANVAHRRHLLVFAVDEHRRVYWYQPAWTDPGANPTAVSIASDDAVHEIPQVVYHRFDGQRLQLYGVFVDQRLSVREVEAAVASAPSDAGGRLSLTLTGAEVIRLDLRLVEGR